MAERECLWACLKHARSVCPAVCAFPQGMQVPDMHGSAYISASFQFRVGKLDLSRYGIGYD